MGYYAPNIQRALFLRSTTAGCSRRCRARGSPARKGRTRHSSKAIVELKSRNPRFGCPRIARIVSQTFGIDVDKNVVHRVSVSNSLSF